MSHIIHQPNDKLFKQSLADIRVATDFFTHYLPADILRKINLDTLCLQQHSFIDEAYKATEADVVYQVELEDACAYLYILCEQQSEVDDEMAFRLFIYMGRILDLHRKQNPQSPLPVIYSLVVYTGEAPWDAPTHIFDLFGKQKELAKQLFLQPYQIIDVHRLEDDVLKQQLWSGVVAFVLKYRKTQDLTRFLEAVLPWIHEIELHEGKDFAKIVLRYMVNGLDSNEKNKTLFLEKIQQHLSSELQGEAMTLAQMFKQEGIEQGMLQGMKQGIQQGMQQGMQQGVQLGEKAVLLIQLQRKFGALAPQYLQQLDEANAEELLEMANTVLDAKTLTEVFGKILKD